jgi:hypothetical protein
VADAVRCIRGPVSRPGLRARRGYKGRLSERSLGDPGLTGIGLSSPKMRLNLISSRKLGLNLLSFSSSKKYDSFEAFLMGAFQT